MFVDKYNCGNNEFLVACYEGTLEEIKRLVSTGVDINHRNSFNNNGFLLACCFNTIDVIKYLVYELKFDKNFKNNSGNGLILACRRNNIKIIKFLVEDLKLDVNILTSGVYSALSHACWHNDDMDVFEYLVVTLGLNTNYKEIKHPCSSKRKNIEHINQNKNKWIKMRKLNEIRSEIHKAVNISMSLEKYVIRDLRRIIIAYIY
jgi:ankyrin repeat protein